MTHRGTDLMACPQSHWLTSPQISPDRGPGEPRAKNGGSFPLTCEPPCRTGPRRRSSGTETCSPSPLEGRSRSTPTSNETDHFRASSRHGAFFFFTKGEKLLDGHLRSVRWPNLKCLLVTGQPLWSWERTEKWPLCWGVSNRCEQRLLNYSTLT